jgi:hypothetical protein
MSSCFVPNSFDKNHSLIVSEFVNVSCVVNVLETTTKGVQDLASL